MYVLFIGVKGPIFSDSGVFFGGRFPTNMSSTSFFQAEKKVYARLDAHVQRKRQGQDVTLVVTGHLGAMSCWVKRWVLVMGFDELVTCTREFNHISLSRPQFLKMMFFFSHGYVSFLKGKKTWDASSPRMLLLRHQDEAFRIPICTPVTKSFVKDHPFGNHLLMMLLGVHGIHCRDLTSMCD